jgi:hypothetical protein
MPGQSSRGVCRFNGCGVGPTPVELNEGQLEKQGENPASSDSRAFEDSEDGVGKDEAA